MWTFFFAFFFFFVVSAGNKYKIGSQREPNVFNNLLVKQLVLVPDAYELARIHQRARLKLTAAACWVIFYVDSEVVFSYSLSIIGVSNFINSGLCWWLLMTCIACQAFIDVICWLIYILAALMQHHSSWMLRINTLLSQPEFCQGPYVW